MVVGPYELFIKIYWKIRESGAFCSDEDAENQDRSRSPTRTLRLQVYAANGVIGLRLQPEEREQLIAFLRTL